MEIYRFMDTGRGYSRRRYRKNNPVEKHLCEKYGNERQALIYGKDLMG